MCFISIINSSNFTFFHSIRPVCTQHVVKCTRMSVIVLCELEFLLSSQWNKRFRSKVPNGHIKSQKLLSHLRIRLCFSSVHWDWAHINKHKRKPNTLKRFVERRIEIEHEIQKGRSHLSDNFKTTALQRFSKWSKKDHWKWNNSLEEYTKMQSQESETDKFWKVRASSKTESLKFTANCN